VFVGDGLSDVCAASQADVLLARGKLAELAPHLGLEFRPFDDFFDVRREVQRLLSD
jgi:2-hydroxy-3-keto-5-methylthiopentenyl-1-phosphate phosphatase